MSPAPTVRLTPPAPLPPAVAAAFPRAVPLEEFLSRQSRWLASAASDPEEALAVTASCRDEMVADLRAGVRRFWHRSFDFSSLSGLPLSGVTGMKAVLDHAPQTGRRLEIVIFALPHIGILADGTAGQSLRRGRRDPTSACGSLNGAIAWARTNPTVDSDGGFDEADPEQSLVRMHLLAANPDLAQLEPVTLVRRTAALMRADLWELVLRATESGEVDVALVGGILVHGPDGDDYVSPEAVRLISEGEDAESAGAFAP